MNLSPGKPGHVYLMGAGPSDPNLLTCRAKSLLGSCDVVAYDALVSPILLGHVRFEAELVRVGYRGHDGRQPFGMHPSVIERALAGKSVARLKSGDPVIYSRIAQEIQDLKAHGIPYEIIPGITTANAAAAYMGMPLTHRDLASDVIFVSGHDLHSKGTPQSDWQAVCRITGTMVVYMGAARLEETCAKLIAYGKAPATPAALLSAIGSPKQGMIAGTLADLAEKADAYDGAKSPGLIVVGEIVRQDACCGWLSQRLPLFGRAILWADSEGVFPPSSATCLASTGAHLHAAYRVRRTEIAHAPVVDTGYIARHDYFAFSAPDAFELFARRLGEAGMDLRALHGKRVIALGQTTYDAMVRFALNADLCADDLLSCAGNLQGVGVVFCSVATAPRLTSEIAGAALNCSCTPLYQYETRWDVADGVEGDLIVADEESAHRVSADSGWRDRIGCCGVVALSKRAADALLELCPELPSHMVTVLHPEELVGYFLLKQRTGG